MQRETDTRETVEHGTVRLMPLLAGGWKVTADVPGKLQLTVELSARDCRPLNPLRKTLWLAQLLGGTYSQTNGRLISYSDPDRRCCLGVAVDLCPTLVDHVTHGEHYLRREGERRGSTGLLTPGLREWLGVADKAQNALANLNDRGVSFEDIAFVIDTIL